MYLPGNSGGGARPPPAAQGLHCAASALPYAISFEPLFRKPWQICHGFVIKLLKLERGMRREHL